MSKRTLIIYTYTNFLKNDNNNNNNKKRFRL